MYMFTDPELRKRFHARVAGYVPSLSRTLSYMKILNWNSVRTNITNFNLRVMQGEFKSQLAKVNLTVVFKILGAPTLSVHLGESGLEADAPEENADVTITCDMATANLMIAHTRNVRTLTKSVVTGKLKLRGSLRNLVVAYKNIWVFREILGKRTTENE